MDCSRGLGLPVTAQMQYSVDTLRRMNISLITFKNSGPTVSVTETNQLLLCGEDVAIHSVSHTKHTVLAEPRSSECLN
jgi:hypothetical protein